MKSWVRNLHPLYPKLYIPCQHLHRMSILLTPLMPHTSTCVAVGKTLPSKKALPQIFFQYKTPRVFPLKTTDWKNLPLIGKTLPLVIGIVIPNLIVQIPYRSTLCYWSSHTSLWEHCVTGAQNSYRSTKNC